MPPNQHPLHGASSPQTNPPKPDESRSTEDMRAARIEHMLDAGTSLYGGKLRRGREVVSDQHCVNSGFAALNQELPNGGWPLGSLCELLCEQQGIGELQMLIPALAELSQKKWIVFVNPPQTPYAPALKQQGVFLEHCLVIDAQDNKDQLWVMEQALLSDSCGAVLAWPQSLHAKQLRRLQLAASQKQGLGFLYRKHSAAKSTSPAHLRIKLKQSFKADHNCDEQSINLEMIKRPHAWPLAPFDLTLRNFATPLYEQNYASEIVAHDNDSDNSERLNRLHVFNPLDQLEQEPKAQDLPISRSSHIKQ